MQKQTVSLYYNSSVYLEAYDTGIETCPTLRKT